MNNDISKKFKSFAVKHNFSRSGMGAETHWYFIEAEEAYCKNLYLASVLCSFNGIESSIRTILMYDKVNFDNSNLKEDNLNNNLILRAKVLGLNVEILAFPDEFDFYEKLSTKKQVEIVRNRHNFCHGNVFGFIQTDPVTGQKTFEPCYLKDFAKTLLDIGKKWAAEMTNHKNMSL